MCLVRQGVELKSSAKSRLCTQKLYACVDAPVRAQSSSLCKVQSSIKRNYAASGLSIGKNATPAASSAERRENSVTSLASALNVNNSSGHALWRLRLLLLYTLLLPCTHKAVTLMTK